MSAPASPLGVSVDVYALLSALTVGGMILLLVTAGRRVLTGALR